MWNWVGRRILASATTQAPRVDPEDDPFRATDHGRGAGRDAALLFRRVDLVTDVRPRRWAQPLAAPIGSEEHPTHGGRTPGRVRRRPLGSACRPRCRGYTGPREVARTLALYNPP